MKGDMISRQDAIDALNRLCPYPGEWSVNGLGLCKDAIANLPSAQSEVKPIEYRDCANAMLRMWMDNVVTDGEYNRIMDKLNAHEIAKRRATPR